MSNETVLKLGDLIIPVGAGRGINQTLQPIDNGDIRRTVNGALVDMTREVNRKFESQISATDMATPTLAGIWKGSTITVHCIEKLRQLLNPAGTNITLIREPVPGSIVGFNSSGDKIEPSGVTGQDVTFPSVVSFVEFRPILEMMVLAKSQSDDEYAAETTWSIDLEEV